MRSAGTPAAVLVTHEHGDHFDAETLAALPAHPVMRRWWAHMADIMATQPDGAPVAVPLVPMFHLP